MIRIIDIDKPEEWDELVRQLPNHDVYYLSGYVKAFACHGDGHPILLWWECDDVKGACVLMIRDIADDPRFATMEKGKIFDAVTPYGYGGFIFNANPGAHRLNLLRRELLEALSDKNVISVFFRFHPVLENAPLSRELCDVIDLGKTISLDLSDDETIWANLTSKNRNMIRKAEKSGVEIFHDNGFQLLLKFKEIYDETMRNDNADDYYFFGEDFYKSLSEDLKDNYEIFYAALDGEIISMAIFLFDNDQLHYHLSGSLKNYRNLAPSNLLLYKVALWGRGKGYKSLHLGGGVGSGADSLYKFKAAFNRNSTNQFSIGKLIVDQTAYNELVEIRKLSEDFNINSTFFPLYRS